MKIKQIDKEINKIGNRMIKCNLKKKGLCEDIENNKKKGIIPRCLFLELNENKNRGVIVIGINPGHAELKKERKEMKNNSSYRKYKKFFEEKILKKRPYYERTKKMIKELNFDGPILWTELVKCESKGKKIPKIETMRECINNYLIDEIRLIKNWPLIALGNHAYRFCSIIFYNKQVIGVPHPSLRSRLKIYKKNDDGKIIINRSKLKLKEFFKYRRKFKNKPFAIKIY